MKAVLISIQPKWVEKIVSGEKTVEVRKTRPKIDPPFKCYIYCAKGKPFIQKIRFGDIAISHTQITKNLYNGKVIGEFVCDRIEEFTVGSLRCDDIQEEACLRYGEIIDYFYKKDGSEDLKVKFGYAWHISDLKIYDKPKELSEFRLTCNHKNDCGTCKEWGYFLDFSDGHCNRLEKEMRPPQSWCYVEEL